MRSISTALVLLALVLSIPGRAQDPEAPDPGERIARLPLLELRGKHVAVRYSAGALQRATNVQRPFELLAADFGRWSGVRNRFSMLLLSRDEWQDAGIAMPYGLPVRLRGSNVAAAAWGDPGTVELWGRLLGWDMPAVEEAPMRSTSDEAASLVATDLLGLFEATRLLMDRAGIGGDEAWLGDVMAHTVAATVIARTPGSGLAGATRLYGRIAASRGGALPLEAYRSGLSLDDWLWFQARFFAAASVIVDEERRGAGKAIVKLARKNGGRLSKADLVGRWPALDLWLREGFGQGAPGI